MKNSNNLQNLNIESEIEISVNGEVNTLGVAPPTISAKMQQIINEYPVGSIWDKTYGPKYDSECKGFGELVYKKYFGIEQWDSEYYWAATS